MTSHAKIGPFGAPAFALTVALAASAGCSSSPASSEAEAADGGAIADPNQPSVIDPASLGAPCTGGCGEGQACALADSSCPEGLCGVDYREAKHSLACTADCSSRPCPEGWDCVDVVGARQGQRACMPTRARIKLSVVISGGDRPSYDLDTTVPASGDAETGCGKVELLAEDAVSSKLRVSACRKLPRGGIELMTMTFPFPRTPSKVRSVIDVTRVVIDDPLGPSQLKVCDGVATVEREEQGRRVGGLTGTATSGCGSSNTFWFPFDAAITLRTARD